jgi:hypothetical protein
LAQSGTVPISNGGTGQTTQGAAFDALAPTTSKGDLIVHNGTTDIRLPVGTNNHVLTADSTEASGVKWAAAAGGASPITISNKTGAYTVVAGDLGTIINCTSGTFTVSLTAAATLGSGFNCWVWNTGSGVITIDPNGAETIDGVSAIVLRQGEGTQVVCSGSNWLTGDKKTMRNYAENAPSGGTRPSATGSQSLAIGGGSSASNTGGLAIGQNVTSTNNYSAAIGNNSGNGGSQAVTSGAMALGGSYASGTDSFAASVATNSSSFGATGTNSVAIGLQARATTTYAVSIGVFTAVTGSQSLAIGNSAGASGSNSIAIGSPASAATSATASRAVAIGDAAWAATIGKFAFSNGLLGSQGDSQYGLYTLRRSTTDATATVLTTDNTAPGNTDQVILPNNSAYAFTGTVVARRQASGGTASAAWKVEGLIRREGSAGTTTLVASTVTAISNVPGWTLALSADTTNGCLAVTATGAAATNIRWVATIQTSELTYA